MLTSAFITPGPPGAEKESPNNTVRHSTPMGGPIGPNHPTSRVFYARMRPVKGLPETVEILVWRLVILMGNPRGKTTKNKPFR